jgi:DNA-binding Xre family transcriptional regulator
MISFDPLWEQLKNKKISTYTLQHTALISSSTLTRLRNNQSVSTTTIEKLCNLLDCQVSDLMRFEKD